MPSEFTTFSDFYPFYLGEHQDPICRRLHFTGTLLVLVTLAGTLATGHYVWLWLMPVFGYGFAWVGHYIFEGNRPATFKHPLYSLAGDFVMFGDILRGKVKL
ncbi:MAG: DUF962 domain-containing protein [Gemmatimonadales bacterium]